MLYAVVEPIFSSIYWCAILYIMNTNAFCRDMGDNVCDMPDKMVSNDYIIRPYPYWAALLAPGLIFDIIFIYKFR